MPVLLSGVLKPTTKLEILASMPTKATADELVVRFFEAYNPLIPSVRTCLQLRINDDYLFIPNRHAP